MATIEGRNPVIEAIKNDREIDKIMIANSAKEGSIKKIIGMAKEKNIVIQYVDKHKLDEVSTSHSHQGVIAQVSEYKYWELDELIESVKAKNEDPFFIILDEITDPHNLGSIIRTADAFGLTAVIVSPTTCDPYNDKVIRATMGSVWHIPVVRKTMDECFEFFDKENIDTLAMHLKGNELGAGDLKLPCAYFIGNEGDGLTDETTKKCKKLVKIPMKGKAESLNAAVAASLIGFELSKLL